MTLIMRIPGNSKAYFFTMREYSADKFDVRHFTYNYLAAGETNIITIPANTTAHLKVIRDASGDTFDVQKLTYEYSE